MPLAATHVVIWHNPGCSKSRETLALLRARGVEPEIVHYLDAPPRRDEIRGAARALGVCVRDMLRAKEPLYLEMRLDNPALDDAAIAEAASRTPVLIERPIVFSRGQARIGRPPEAVLEIL